MKIKADFLRALAHPTRLAIIEALKNGDSRVGDLAKRIGIEQSSLSKHLAIMRTAGILASRQDKTTIVYSVAEPDIYFVLRSVVKILSRRMKAGQALLTQLGKPLAV